MTSLSTTSGSNCDVFYTTRCTGCRREFTNYPGGATYCLRCTRDELEKARIQGIKDEVRSLVDIAREIVEQAANQASLYDSADEAKLDDIAEALRHV